MIIGFAGLAGSGKSTAAAILAERHGFVRTRFAGPLKAMLRAYLETAGVTDTMAEHMIEGDLKEVPCDVLGGRSPRFAMQTLGTDWGRDMMRSDLWTQAWVAGARAALVRGAPGVVVEDCRFPNEAETIRSLSGFVVRVEREGHAGIGTAHTSETQVFSADETLRNPASLDALRGQVGALMLRLQDRSAAFRAAA